jgi:bifunctional aspartokinase / homoserine dehydrogenase 1
MKVIKIGGGCLNGNRTIAGIMDLLATHGKGNVVVVSALHGVTNKLLAGMRLALADEAAIPGHIKGLRDLHHQAAERLIHQGPQRTATLEALEILLKRLKRYYFGLNFTAESTPRIKDLIASFGERLCARLLTGVMQARGLAATCHLPEEIGLITDGKYGDATANLSLTSRNITDSLRPHLREDSLIFIPGFYGVSKAGELTTFGRGGSDYAAAVIAATLEAEVLEIWKDTRGFMSADPRMVSEATLIPTLSYAEAAELAYFGARILHPRTVEPVRGKKIPIAIKNTLDPDGPHSVIHHRSPLSPQVIKSVAHANDIGILKVNASGVGARPGILAQVAGAVSERGVNIKSVVTSQTCISLLLDRSDIERAHEGLKASRPRPYRRIETVTDIALISIVGEGLLQRQGIAAQCFTAVAACKVNVEMISFGPSPAALYFLCREADLAAAVTAIHSTFFGAPRCLVPTSRSKTS